MTKEFLMEDNSGVQQFDSLTDISSDPVRFLNNSSASELGLMKSTSSGINEA